MNYQALREIFPHVKSGAEILEMEFPPQEWLIDSICLPQLFQRQMMEYIEAQLDQATI